MGKLLEETMLNNEIVKVGDSVEIINHSSLHSSKVGLKGKVIEIEESIFYHCGFKDSSWPEVYIDITFETENNEIYKENKKYLKKIC